MLYSCTHMAKVGVRGLNIVVLTQLVWYALKVIDSECPTTRSELLCSCFVLFASIISL